MFSSSFICSQILLANRVGTKSTVRKWKYFRRPYFYTWIREKNLYYIIIRDLDASILWFGFRLELISAEPPQKTVVHVKMVKSDAKIIISLLFKSESLMHSICKWHIFIFCQKLLIQSSHKHAFIIAKKLFKQYWTTIKKQNDYYLPLLKWVLLFEAPVLVDKILFTAGKWPRLAWMPYLHVTFCLF